MVPRCTILRGNQAHVAEVFVVLAVDTVAPPMAKDGLAWTTFARQTRPHVGACRLGGFEGLASVCGTHHPFHHHGIVAEFDRHKRVAIVVEREHGHEMVLCRVGRDREGLAPSLASILGAHVLPPCRPFAGHLVGQTQRGSMHRDAGPFGVGHEHVLQGGDGNRGVEDAVVARRQEQTLP